MSRHTLLQAQIRKSARPDGGVDQERLLDLVSAAYDDNDRDRRRTDRSIDLMVEEVDALNASLESLVTERTNELKSVRITLDAALQNTAQGFFIMDEAGRVVACNERALELLDLPAELMAARPHANVVKRYLFENGEFDNAEPQFLEWMEKNCLSGAPPVYQRRRRNGQVLEICTTLLAEGGAVRTVTDVTEAHNQIAALQQAERLHRNLFENAAAGLYRARLDGRIINANLALARIFGCDTVAEYIDSFNSRSRWRPVGEDWRPAFARKLYADGHVTDFICEVEVIATGERMWCAQTAWLVRDAEGKPLYYEGSVANITERKVAESRLAYQALHDPLTGLLNRAALMQWLATHDRAADDDFAILCIDLDRFKAVNDDLGHAAGDALLRDAAARLSEATRGRDFVVRLGGDEFAVIQLSPSSPRAVGRYAERLIRALSEDYHLDGRLAAIGASVGCGVTPDRTVSGEQLLKNADIALYRAKTDGGGRARIYDDVLDAEYARRHMIENNLRTALAEGQFTLFYQPILSLAVDAVTGYEALIRWTHPTAGPISPAEFIPIAEQSDAINPIGEWVLREACATFARGDGKAEVSVNVSATQLRGRGFVAMVVDALAKSGLSPRRLTLEITETALLSDCAATRRRLRDLRALGVRIALDDFGVGHSSLTYLKKYPFDKIKIDRTFIAGRRRNKVNNAVIKAVISLGRDLGFDVVAEGIETDEQLSDLAAMGCGFIQGYHIGKPAPAEHWPELAAKSSPERRVA
jgi:diguanylate cyclase (GGDEF)-like protein/PAS domain S-box-containing protein